MTQVTHIGGKGFDVVIVLEKEEDRETQHSLLHYGMQPSSIINS